MPYGVSQYDALELVGHEAGSGYMDATFTLEEPSRERLYTLAVVLTCDNEWWNLRVTHVDGEPVQDSDLDRRVARWFDSQDHTSTEAKLHESYADDMGDRRAYDQLDARGLL